MHRFVYVRHNMEGLFTGWDTFEADADLNSPALVEALISYLHDTHRSPESPEVFVVRRDAGEVVTSRVIVLQPPPSPLVVVPLNTLDTREAS